MVLQNTVKTRAEIQKEFKERKIAKEERAYYERKCMCKMQSENP